MKRYVFFLFIGVYSVVQLAAQKREVVVYTTAKDSTFRLTQNQKLAWQSFGQPVESQPSIFVDSKHTFQTHLGIGGAFTDAAAETFAKLSKAKQNEFLDLYFDDKKGIGYTFGRTNINSCDFSSDMYTYIDEGDKTLTTFNIQHDLKYKLPFIKKAAEKAKGKLKIFASPWSPPAFMKDNNNMLQGGKLKKEFYQVWANYYIKFIEAYKKQGLNIWGISVQNEPMAKQTWESCIYEANDELVFARDYLGPTLHQTKHQDVKLIAWDHNRDLLYHRAETLLSDAKAAKYIWGIGFHWYEIWNGGRQYENVKRVAESFPQTNLLLTEACNYPFSWEHFNEWQWGENYGENIIHDFNNGAVAWTDWNLLLDEVGGPNHVNNFCYAPIHAKTQKDEIELMNSYYYIGHFSKFIRPNAKRISVSSNRAQLLTTGFLNPDGSKIVIVMNPTNESIQYRMYDHDKAVVTTSFAHSIATLVWK